jgi:hypothetical protein
MARLWTPLELEMLREMYPDCHTDDIAAWLGVSRTRIYAAAARLGIRKSPEYLASDAAGRLRADRLPANTHLTRFQVGLVPWNKGKKGSTGYQAECRQNWFKKGEVNGHARQKLQPIGSYRINGDGYLDRKITALGRGPRDWEAVHRLVWKEQVGPIPPGHIVAFKPGTRTTVLKDITPARLECVTKAEIAKRNHPKNRSPEYACLVQIKGAITRQVNRITREAQESTQ